MGLKGVTSRDVMCCGKARVKQGAGTSTSHCCAVPCGLMGHKGTMLAVHIAGCGDGKKVCNHPRSVGLDMGNGSPVSLTKR